MSQQVPGRKPQPAKKLVVLKHYAAARMVPSRASLRHSDQDKRVIAMAHRAACFVFAAFHISAPPALLHATAPLACWRSIYIAAIFSAI